MQQPATTLKRHETRAVTGGTTSCERPVPQLAIDDAISRVAEVESGETPPGLEGTKMLMLVNRESGKGLGVTLFESEEAMRRGDEALNAMSPGGTERRTSVEFYEVPVRTIS